MPALAWFFSGLVISLVTSLVGRTLLALGVGYVVYSGFNLSSTWLLDQIKANFQGMGVETASFLAWLWVDKAIGLVFSAYAAALIVKLAGGSTLTKLVFGGGSSS